MTETETDHEQILEFVQRCRDEHIAPYRPVSHRHSMKPCVAALMTKPSAAQRSCQKGVQAKAAIRAEVMSWGVTDATIDPGEQLLCVVTRSAARAEMYTQKLKFSASLGPCSSTMGDTRARTTNPADRASYL